MSTKSCGRYKWCDILVCDVVFWAASIQQGASVAMEPEPRMPGTTATERMDERKDDKKKKKDENRKVKKEGKKKDEKGKEKKRKARK